MASPLFTYEDAVKYLHDPDPVMSNRAGRFISKSDDLAFLDYLMVHAKPEDPKLEHVFCKYLENIDPEVAMPPLKTLLTSPNIDTRQDAIRALEKMPLENQVPVLVELSGCGYREIQLFFLKQVRRFELKRAVLDIIDYLKSQDEGVLLDTVETLEFLDLQVGVAPLVDAAGRVSEPVQVAILKSLARMSVFKRWQLLTPFLNSDSSKVRKAAVLSIIQTSNGAAWRELCPLLKTETDQTICKFIIDDLMRRPSAQIIDILIQTAATNPDAQVRRLGSWAIDKLDHKVIANRFLALVDRASEPECAFILVKMGQLGLSDCGKTLVKYVKAGQTPRIRIAAVEGLGYLNDKQYLQLVSSYIFSDDQLISYVATVSAVRMVDMIEESPKLVSLMFSSEEKHMALKQIVLQYMSNSLSWVFSDEKLCEALIDNLDSSNISVRYLSGVLLGKYGRASLIDPLIHRYFIEDDASVKDAIVLSVDQILDGQIGCILDRIETQNYEGHAQFLSIIELLGQVKWVAGSAQRALVLFADLKESDFQGKPMSDLEAIAKSVYRAAGEAVHRFMAQADAPSIWRYVLGKSWLDTFRDMHSQYERNAWELLFSQPDPRLMQYSVEKAVYFNAKWTVDSLLERTFVLSGPEKAALKPRIKALMEL